MIKNPKDIDLTVDRKFHERANLKIQDTLRKLKNTFSRNKIVCPDIFMGKRSALLPWNSKPITSETGLVGCRKRRNNGDALSDDFGATIRVTSQNNLWIIGGKIHYPEVLEEFFAETIGGPPYEAIVRCVSCSKKRIYRYEYHKWRYGRCSKCKLRVPWRGPVNRIRIEDLIDM